MQVLDTHTAAQQLAKSTGKPVLFLRGLNYAEGPVENTSEYLDNDNHLLAAPFLHLADDDHLQAIVDGYVYVLCDSDEELQQLFGQVVGDDGPTGANPYNGPHIIYDDNDTLTMDKLLAAVSKAYRIPEYYLRGKPMKHVGSGETEKRLKD